jgi:hypothetical protein
VLCGVCPAGWVGYLGEGLGCGQGKYGAPAFDVAPVPVPGVHVAKARHYIASQLLAARFDLQNTAARLGHGGGATTLKHYADPVSEVDLRAAAYLAELTGANSSVQD